MKKMAFIAAIVVAALSVKAAVLDWNINGTQAQTGYKVYLMTSLADGGYENEQAIANAALDYASIVQNGRVYQTMTQKAEVANADAVKSVFAIIVDPSDSSNYYVKSLGSLSSYVYDPNQQQSSPGAYGQGSGAETVSTLISGGTKTAYSAIPEPTTVALLALGLAALGLKRKVA